MLITFFTLIKGFIGTGILFLPKGFKNGGYIFSSGAIFLSLFLTAICTMKLLQARKKNNGGSFTELGIKSMGKWGKIAVDVSLASS
jgi:amino acid permease